RLVLLDIAAEAVQRELEAFRPEVVFHQAAQASVPVSLQRPGHDARVNIIGTIRLLEMCLAAGVRKVIYASSAAVYGTPCYLPIDENHPVYPLSPYGISKLAAEMYLSVFRKHWGLDFTVLRYANVYGPRQDALGEGGVVAVFADRIRRCEQLTVFGDGEQTRDFIHVHDVARANLAAFSSAGGQVLNVSTGRATSVNQLVTMFKRLTRRVPSVTFAAARPGDIRHSYLDNSKARSELNWAPQYDLETGLAQTLRAIGLLTGDKH
ncbi:NAD-dependent epimerase/dehydratase family protein, partial [Desulforudis sp. 1190]